MKANIYLTIIFSLLMQVIAFAQGKTLIGTVSFNCSVIEKTNYVFGLGYNKINQNNVGTYYIKYYFDIGYANQNNFNYIIPSFTYHVYTLFYSKGTIHIPFGIRATDFIFNNHNDIRIAPTIYYNFLRNNLQINYSYNYPIDQDNYEGKFLRHCMGIKLGFHPFFKKDNSKPLK